MGKAVLSVAWDWRMLPKIGRICERTVWIEIAKADAEKRTDRF